MLKTDNEPISVDGDVAMQDMTAPVVEHAFVTVLAAVLEQEFDVLPSQADDSTQNPAQVELKQVVPNPCPLVDVKALNLVKVEFAKSLRYFQPSDAVVVEKYVDKFDVILGKWSALFTETDELIKDFQQSKVKADAITYILRCFGKEAFKISESFDGIKAVLASVGSTSPPVSQAAQPCKSDAAPAKPTASAQGGPVLSKSAKAVSSANMMVSVSAVSPKSKTGKERRVSIQGSKAENKVIMPSGNAPDAINITTHASGRRVVSGAKQQSVTGAVKSLSDAGEWFHGVVKFGRGDKGDVKWGCGEIADGSDVDFVFILREAYSHLRKGNKIKFQVQDHLDWGFKQAINILRESGAPLPLALPSVPNDNKLECGPKAAVFVPAPLAAVTKVVSDSSGVVDVLKTLEKVLAGLLKIVNERPPPPVPPSSAPRN